MVINGGPKEIFTSLSINDLITQMKIRQKINWHRLIKASLVSMCIQSTVSNSNSSKSYFCKFEPNFRSLENLPTKILFNSNLYNSNFCKLHIFEDPPES